MDTFDIPSATSTVAGISAYSAPFFTEYLPIIYVPLALTAVALGLLWLVKKGNGFFSRLLAGRGKRRGRR